MGNMIRRCCYCEDKELEEIKPLIIKKTPPPPQVIIKEVPAGPISWLVDENEETFIEIKL